MKNNKKLAIGAIALSVFMAGCSNNGSFFTQIPTPLCADDVALSSFVKQTTTNTASGDYSSNLDYYVGTYSGSDASSSSAASGGSATVAVVALKDATDLTTNAIVIPAYFNTIPVIGIYPSGFANYQPTNSLSITFPSTFSSADTMPTGVPAIIGSQAFANTNIASFALPNTLKVLNPSVFLNCSSLKEVTLSQTDCSLTGIGDNCFTGDKLLDTFDFNFTDLVSIGDSAFAGCHNLQRCLLPLTCTTLGNYVFSECYNLGLIYFSSGMQTCGSWICKNCRSSILAAFAGDSIPSGFAIDWDFLYYTAQSGTVTSSAGGVTTKNIQRINITKNRSDLGYSDGFTYFQCTTQYPNIPDGYGYDIIIYSYNWTDQESCYIPAALKDSVLHRVVEIASNAFQDHTELLNLYFYTGSEMSESEFGAHLSSNLRAVRSYAFLGCTALQVLDLQYATSLTTIDDYGFVPIATKAGNNFGTSTIQVATLVIPYSVQTIGSYAFAYYSNLTSLTFQDSTTTNSALTTIRDHAFWGAGATTYPISLTGVFDTVTLTIPGQSLTSIGDRAFGFAVFFTNLVFAEPDDASSTAKLTIGTMAFESFRLCSVHFGSHVTELKDYAFAFSVGWRISKPAYSTMHRVFVPSTITTLGVAVFVSFPRLAVYTDAATASTNTGWNADWNQTYANVSTYNYNNSNNGFFDVGIRIGDNRSDDKTFVIKYYPTYYGCYEGTASSGSSSLRNLVSYTGSDGNTIDYLQIAATGTSSAYCIATRFYYDQTTANKTVVIPNTVTINNVSCTVKRIGYCAFSNSWNGAVSGVNNQTATISIPNGVETIGNRAFAGSQSLKTLKSYTGTTYTANFLPSSLTSLGDLAFAYTIIGTLHINSNITTLHFVSADDPSYLSSETGTGPFVLAGLSYNNSSTGLSSFGADYTDANATYVTSGAGFYQKNSATDYTLVGVAPKATTLTINSNCKSIADSVLSYSRISTVVFDANLTSIGANAFLYAAISNGYVTGATDPGSGVLNLSGLSNLSTLGNSAFYNCTGLSSIVLPDANLKVIPYSCFANCTSLTSMHLPTGTTDIEAYAFYKDNKLVTFNVPTTLKTIGEKAFNGNTALKGPNSDGVLPLATAANLTSIGESAFESCTSITSVTFPTATSSLSIGQNAFKGCTSLKDVTFPAAISSLGISAFEGCTSLGLGTSTSVDLSALTAIGVIPEGLFNGCTNLQGATLPSNITIIHNLSFQNCTSLKSITIPSGVTTLGTSCFANDSGFTASSVTIPDSVTSIGTKAFSGSNAPLRFNSSNESTLTLGDNAFDGASGLTNTVFPINTKFTGGKIFDNVTNLPTIFLYAMGNEKDAKGTSFYPTNWNQNYDGTASHAAIPYACYLPTTCKKTGTSQYDTQYKSADTGALYWDFNSNNVPEVFSPTWYTA